VKELEKEYGGKVDFKEIDISEDLETAQKYGVQSTPTIVILDPSGTVADTLVGLPEKTELKASLERVLSK
jgi:thioredoxin-like negative regulator of GroEL